MAFQMNLDQVLLIAFLYVGPDIILPLASLLAAGIGILLMVWNRITSLVRKAWKYCFKKSHSASP